MFENILKYQKLDLQLIRLEKKLNESTNKKVISEMVTLVKELQGLGLSVKLIDSETGEDVANDSLVEEIALATKAKKMS